jgi:hypothetical protein
MKEEVVEPSFHPATLWGIGGVVALLVQAIVRISPMAAEPFTRGDLSATQWAAYLGFAVFMAWSEGYRGFQRAFSPRVVARAFALGRHPRPLHVLLAPAYCMALLHAPRRRLIVSWTLLTMIVLLVIGVRSLPYPWRAIVDGGVVVGLGWGLLSILTIWVGAATGGRPLRASPELPVPSPAT